MLKRYLFFVMIALLLVSCSKNEITKTIAPTDTSVPLAQATPTLASTVTPLPPTAILTSTSTPTVTPTITPTPLPVSYGPNNFPADINPLTGLKVADPKVLDRRPLGIKVNIVPRGTTRPPWGLSFADIVYDYYHNSGYSRYHAIFYGEDATQVGSIRSGRLLDDSLVRMYKSIFVYGGADQRIDKVFLNSDYSNRLILAGYDNLPCPPKPENPLCTFDPGGMHNLIGNTDMIRQFAAKNKIDSTRPNLNGMFFWIIPPEGGKPGTQLTVRFSSDNYNRWDYDPALGRYLLSQDNVWDEGQGEKFAPLVDRVTNQQIGADNVVILIAPHEYFVAPVEGSQGEIVDVILSGSGPAYAFRDGQVYQVLWNRPALDSVLYLTFADGTNYPYKPGKTWYQVINKTSVITQPTDNSWRFEFHMP